MFTLDQALNAIKDKPEFSVKNKGSYTVIDYNLNTRDTFVGKNDAETKILLNLRGTAFDESTGRIIRLGYHKFFNYGEYPDTDKQLNFSDEHVITQKLDGSCVFPIYSNEGIFLGTRAGVTDIALMAEKFAIESDIDYSNFIFECMTLHWATPIFEFCSRKNRVVLDYPEDMLILTGLRYIDDGIYVEYDQMKAIADSYGVPVVLKTNSIIDESFDDLKESVSELVEDEGVVIRFEDGKFHGHMIKLKSSDYVKKHKAMDGLKFAKDVALLSLDSLLDDVYPLLDESTMLRVRNFSDDLQSSLTRFIHSLKVEFESMKHIETRKEFAASANKSKYVKFLFALLDGKDAEKLVIDFAKRQCGTQADFADLQKFVGMTVTY